MRSTLSTGSLTDAIAVAIARLSAQPIGGYSLDGEPASEPTAWSAIALAGAEARKAPRPAEWLADLQSHSGSVGVTESHHEPAWTTSLAMLAWRRVDQARFASNIARAAEWALDQQPWVAPRGRVLGHDTTLEGWSWAPDTHSWLEPTAFFAVALRETGFVDHPRRDEAVRLLVDRLLPDGGANFGNTIVLGQQLLQHVHSSGVVAWALAGEGVDDPRLAMTLDYLESAIEQSTGVASLAWAARGLAAHGRSGQSVAERLIDAWPRVESASGIHKMALFALAASETLRASTGQLAGVR